MSVLIVEPLDADVIAWLAQRYPVRHAPELAAQARELRRSLFNVRALVLPPAVALDALTLQYAPVLRAVGRVSAGAENIDIEACGRAGVEVVRSLTASAPAEAEFMVGALLAMLRRVPVLTQDGLRVGRELGGAIVGLVGLGQAAAPLAQLLACFGAPLLGYDPAVHAADALWQRVGVRPVGLRELLETCDAVCVQLPHFTRYRGLLGERFLSACKPNQVLVSIAPSSQFDEVALAQVLASGRMAAAWFDSLEPGALDPGRPLHTVRNLQVTPRVASTTQEAISRSAWAVARRIDEILSAPAPARPPFRPTGPGDAVGLALGRGSA